MTRTDFDVMTDEPAQRRRDLWGDVTASARTLRFRAYRRAVRLGDRVLGPDPRRATPAGPDVDKPPWLPLSEGTGVLCNLCRWQGPAFDGSAHVELARCPRCGSIGRDRFVHWCMAQRVALHNALRVIECSPRLGDDYRAAMSTWFFYRTSDYDLRAHAGNLRLDLQDIDLPGDAVDVVLCAHVLEHVPDPDRALGELRRVVAPGGHLLLQVPVLQAHTTPATEPEYHDNHTRVFWRFGFDLTARVRDAGFDAALLCTEEMADAVASGENPWTDWSNEFELPGMLAGARTDGVADDLIAIADRRTSRRIGFEPGYQYLTWDCRVPA
ncbi:MAG TPA: methyltransferase domain-containing protein [Nocardioidaceae bacterium]|nr:methyltransferase domain-containing protein [Nocardioidaceae bacterium]